MISLLKMWSVNSDRLHEFCMQYNNFKSILLLKQKLKYIFPLLTIF